MIRSVDEFYKILGLTEEDKSRVVTSCRILYDMSFVPPTHAQTINEFGDVDTGSPFVLTAEFGCFNIGCGGHRLMNYILAYATAKKWGRLEAFNAKSYHDTDWGEWLMDTTKYAFLSGVGDTIWYSNKWRESEVEDISKLGKCRPWS